MVAGDSCRYHTGRVLPGIGSALAKISSIILQDQRSIMTVCTPADDVAGVKDVTVALPHLLGGRGILSRLPLPLSDEENEALRASAQVVRDAIDELEEE